MALADEIILDRPKILVILSSSSIGIDLSQSFGFSFGQVELVYQTCDGVQIGDNILFKPDKATKIVYGSTIYFMIDFEDSNKAFTEVPPP